MRENNDIFDRIMSRQCMAWFLPCYRRYKEMLLYGFFGCGTVLISVGTYALLTEVFSWDILMANAVSWLFATMFAFFTNRTWVFSSHATGIRAFFIQLGSFCFGRFLTLLIEEWMLYFFIGQLQFPNMIIKFIGQIVVILLNYLVSKLVVFRRKK